MPKRTKKRGKPASKPKVTDNVATENRYAPTCNDANQYTNPPVTSDLDDNNYRIIKLTNGLTAMLVSSPSIDYSGMNFSPMRSKARTDDVEYSVCNMDNPGWFGRMMDQKQHISKEAYFELCINVGSYNDPRQVPGVSRLLSKIILKRSKKYSDEDEDFCSWIWQIDGYNSVNDDGEKTVYSFDVQHKYLNETLERFSQSLISPLLSPIDMARLRVELLSEHEEDLRDEEKMEKAAKRHLFKNLLMPKHSACVYGSTYLKGLSLPNDDKVYKEVIKFRERYYSAHRMTIILKADLPLERLEEYVKEYFSKVPNNGLPLRAFTQYNFMNSFDESKYARVYKLSSYALTARSDCESLSVKEIPEKIELTWSMPPSQWLYRTKPDRYLAWLITHQGKGSLISYLRRKKMCTRISSGVGDEEFADNSIYTLFSLSLTLTDEGRKDYRKVLEAIFAYINFLRREGPQRKIYDEIRQIKDSQFRYARDVGNEIDDEVNLSVHMHLYPYADYLAGKHLFFEYDPVSITTYVNLMSPERANIILYEKNTKVTYSEFSSDDIPNEWVESWKNVEPLFDFKLPELNAFRAIDFTLIPVDENTPRKPAKIQSDDLSEIWYSIGTQFRSPMCYVNIFFISPFTLSSPEHAAMTAMFIKLLRRVTNEELYPAQAAGMTFKFDGWRDEGIELLVSGFSQKLPLLMESIAKLIENCSNLLTNDIFEATKKNVLAIYEERLLDQHVVDTLAEDLRLSILKVVHWTRMQKHTALSDLRFPQFRQFVKQFTDHVYVKCLVQGNMTSADAVANFQKFMKILKCGSLLPNTRPELLMHEIPTGSYCCRVESFRPHSKEITVKNYYQCGGYSIRAIVMVDLLTSIIEDPVFDDLRGVRGIEDFEYSVSLWMHDEGVVGYTIEVSDAGEDYEVNPDNLDMDIEYLRQTLHSLFEDMTDNEWLGVMKVFMDQKKLPAGSKKLLYEQSKNWRAIIRGTYEFDDPEQELIVLSKLKVEDVRKWMAYLTTSGNNMRKLSIQVVGGGSLESDVASARKYRLKYLPVTVTREMPKKHHQYMTCIQDFKLQLKVLPIPMKP